MPALEPGQRWGVLGGVFDPIHVGHLVLAQEIKRLRELDGVLIVPTLEPPHRLIPPQASFADRLEMARLALEGQSGLELSRIEERTARPSFTLYTLRALKTAHPGVEFELIIGADQLGAFSNWHRWQELSSEVCVVVGRRPGSDTALPAELSRGRIVILETALVNVSSTDIRARVRDRAPSAVLARMLPPAVAEYIETKQLYR